MSSDDLFDLSTKDTKSLEEKKEVYLLFRDEVYAIIGAAIEVHRVLGPGFMDSSNL